MLVSGWVTGDAGMGHVALTSTRPTLVRGYYDTVFDARDARLTDCIDETISGVKLRIRFLRVNERRHSIAVAAVRGLPVDPVRTRVQHLNIQAASLDDLARSHERVHELGFDMALTVGQHTNDKELSSYARTPSGFEREVGWNPVVVDESTWEPGTHQGISVWGHRPVGRTITTGSTSSGSVPVPWPARRPPFPLSAAPASPTTEHRRTTTGAGPAVVSGSGPCGDPACQNGHAERSAPQFAAVTP